MLKNDVTVDDVENISVEDTPIEDNAKQNDDP